MALIGRALAPMLDRRGANPTLPWGDSTPPAPSMLGGAVAGTTVTEKTALQVAAVYGSIGVISDAVSTLPLNLLSSLDAAKRKRLAPSQLLIQPYSEMSLIDWLVQYCTSLALRGNFYGLIVSRDKQTKFPTQIKPIHPDFARVRRMPDGTIEYRFHNEVIPADNVFHIRYISVPESMVGLNPIEYLRNTLGLARAADLYGASFFQNSALPSGIISVEDDMDEEAVLDLKQQWIQMHQGIGQANMPAVLSGDAKFQAISINPEDAQFLGSRQFSQGEISGMIFRVPPHMIGIVDRTTSWGTGIMQQEQGFVTNTLGGYLTRLENALTALHPDGQYVRFDLTQRLRGDKVQRYQAYALGIEGGWLCADDIRKEEDMAPLPNGQGKIFAPIGQQPGGNLSGQIAQQQKQADNVAQGAAGNQPQQN